MNGQVIPAARPSRLRRALGPNWLLAGNFKRVANYTQATFEREAPGDMDREDEQAFFTRAQFSF